MKNLWNLELTDEEIKEIYNANNNMLFDDDIKNIIDLLKELDCTNEIIKNILLANPLCLSQDINDIKELIYKLKSIGINNLNIVFDSNPWLLNKTSEEIDLYINNRINQIDLESIKEEILNNY